MTKQLAYRATHGPIDEHPTLRAGQYRSHVEGLLTDVSRYIGMSDALLRSVLTMIRYTAPRAWNDPTVEPICSKMQTDLAIALGKTDRAVRNDECALEQIFGMIRKDVSANGSRRSDGNGYRQGLSFTPLIEMIDDLEALRERFRYEERQRKSLRLKCSALRRMVKHSLMNLHPENPDHEGLCRIRDRYRSWSPRYASYTTLEALEAHYFEAVQASNDLDELRAMLAVSSGRAETDYRRYIQDTTEESFVPCNASVENLVEDEPSDVIDPSSASDGALSCLENKCGAARPARTHRILENMTLKRLYELASPDLQTQLEFCRGDRRNWREVDFIHGAHGLLQPLCITASAYHAAVDAMGQYLTTLCLIVIDANRTHPVTPVRNPGGLLRAMTRRHQARRLNIAGSLIGLSARHKHTPPY